MFLGLTQSFIGSLVSSLGHGFDIGTEWPADPLTLLDLLLKGSLEPLHRILTIFVGIAYVALGVVGYRYRGRNKIVAVLSLTAIVFLISTAITGRFVLLALGGEITNPYASLVFSINNLFAFITILSVACLIEVIRIQNGSTTTLNEKNITAIISRGAGAWGVIASVFGAFLLGYAKTANSVPNIPFLGLSFGEDIVSIVFRSHQVFGALAILLTIIAFIISSRRNLWINIATFSAIMQPAIAVLLYYRYIENPWAPGPLLSIHLLLAHILAAGTLTVYISRFLYFKYLIKT